ncbi:LytTR family DNA-binding domain-containing protein [uncultured Eudoraea sp.]|uniref:LytR/AlgR family response regulator transcription factor n=1 Tax=uncultured Eudoraea sp. TaxID=1035614 RepID=UPI0026117529|nr:LytTR family DNA-binding domain-containing protein [uncultured Eudoraea sp.]
MENRCLNTLVIENSKVQGAILAQMVRNHKDLHLVSVCGNAMDANRTIKNHKIDVIFLDIEMPFIDGFDLLESLEQDIQVVIVTGNSDYALKAFDYGVTDFILKPAKIQRFHKAVKKVLKNLVKVDETLDEQEFLMVRSNMKNKKIYLKDIKWVEAFGDYIKLITKYEKVIVLNTMKSIANQLPKDSFLRIHRSYIVNLSMVDKFSGTSVEVGEHSIPMSRKHKPRLELLLEKAGV